MINKRPVSSTGGTSDGRFLSEICPHVIGTGKDGSEMVLSFQFAGQSSKGLPPGGEWRYMRVDEISHVTSHAGAWYTADNHSRPQSCVKNIDVEVSY